MLSIYMNILYYIFIFPNLKVIEQTIKTSILIIPPTLILIYFSFFNQPSWSSSKVHITSKMIVHMFDQIDKLGFINLLVCHDIKIKITVKFLVTEHWWHVNSWWPFIHLSYPVCQSISVLVKIVPFAFIYNLVGFVFVAQSVSVLCSGCRRGRDHMMLHLHLSVQSVPITWPLKLWVRIPLMAKCTWYNIMW